ncbi:aig2 family [Trichoderma arundinaceum]|uniref:gamma-glutamylcyclotransferase n=1 Tax=Trichoderma arundinaceum TaxID=490622 RepID=A0A395NNW8_TRIAR|nr:aig2 family [Trichoderma arundinaceum]
MEAFRSQSVGMKKSRVPVQKAASAVSLDRRPTKLYFAYGSNLHIKQMNRRCPNSKFIGKARLSNYRWQINERGYANVTEAEGHWVDGLVYEIDDTDEAKLDINEGVAKNAYNKRYMTVLLHRAQSTLYRRPVAWIVEKGGPAAVGRQARLVAQGRRENSLLHWQDDVLIYVNPNCIIDSSPKEEYVNRINLGIADARALGVDEDYIRNCIRPFIPEATERIPSGPAPGTPKLKVLTIARGRNENSPARSSGRSPARKERSVSRSKQHFERRSQSWQPPKKENDQRKETATKSKLPPLPPRPQSNQTLEIPIVAVQEVHSSGWGWWPAF